jgi:hypothetical protein
MQPFDINRVIGFGSLDMLGRFLNNVKGIKKAGLPGPDFFKRRRSFCYLQVQYMPRAQKLLDDNSVLFGCLPYAGTTVV